MASVEGANLVKLRWDEAIEPDVAGYNVYRARGSDVRIEGAGKKINPSLIQSPDYIDATVDLSDSVARFYWVTAVNRAGKESGPSPYAMTFPDAPLAVNIDRHETLPAPTNEIRIWWEWPEDVKVERIQRLLCGQPHQYARQARRSGQCVVWLMGESQLSTDCETEYEDRCTGTPELRVHLHHSR